MALILSIALILFFMIGAVSAVNETDVMTQDVVSDDAVSEDVVQEDAAGEETPEETTNSSLITTTIKSNDTNIVKGKDFSVQLTDSNSTPLANKTVKIKVKKVTSEVVTDDNGVAKLKIDLDPGTYTVKYSFSDEGYAKCSNSTEIFVISTSTSKIKGSDYTAYIGVANKYKVTLTVGGVPLANRTVVFNINGKTVSKRTNSNGVASVKIDEKAGTYKISYSYAGEDNIKKSSGTSKITVKKGMPTKIVKENSKVYTHKKKDYFKIKLKDSRANPLASKKVTFKIKGKKYTRKTDSNGIASLKIKLKSGSYKIKVYFKKTSVYNKATKTYKIRVKPVHDNNNGMWLFASDMKKVNFKTLQKYGTKHILLNFICFHYYGKSYVQSWINKANSHGIKVHIWMQVFYGDHGWQYPAKNGKINYKLINSKVKEAKKYAKVKGIAGVHFDYLRYPGTAYKHAGSVKAVNLFVKEASTAIHKINKKLIVSAAVMPEPSSMKHYYAQDIPTMGKYLDAIVPMVYKGNYHGNANWIKSVTKTFAKQSKKAQIWTGLQAYRSDSHVTKLSAKELTSDANAAIDGGADGVILFRFGLFNYINFKGI
ncbi:putative glycoside hydrolase [Methanobrevibacter sp.]|uniref:putative glycoside hydrolase n=1 Tax=Methanobrevibacter sp. TaxID=66852 RepID=UPI00260145EE|nr:Ig-like domain repeat protein [Methanobrevibacter sp.]MBR4448298.1 hypothetical protein [Methanobrevibacter sp.]